LCHTKCQDSWIWNLDGLKFPFSGVLFTKKMVSDDSFNYQLAKLNFQ
jgi:hypothetical protein